VITSGLKLVMAASIATTGMAPIERPARDDTIYVLYGESAELEAFEAELGEWQGGERIEKDVQQDHFVYWAYSERTAPEARQFLIPALTSGLKLEIFSYDQTALHPDKRAVLDQIAVSCGFEKDPFFVAPTGYVRFEPPADTAFDTAACALKEARTSDLINPSLIFIGNEVIEEAESE
jgi:hypothetical protein